MAAIEHDPRDLVAFSANVLDPSWDHFTTVNLYLHRHCATTEGLDGVFGALLGPAVRNYAAEWRTVVSPGAGVLQADSADLRKAARRYERNEQYNADSLFTTGKRLQPGSGVEERVAFDTATPKLSVGAFKRVSYGELGTPEVPAGQKDFKQAFQELDSKLGWLEQKLREYVDVDLHGYVQPLIGDWGVLWRISDAWRRAAGQGGDTAGMYPLYKELHTFSPALYAHWNGPGARAFEFHLDRFEAAVLAASNQAQYAAESVKAGAVYAEKIFNLVFDKVEEALTRVMKLATSKGGAAGKYLEVVDLVVTFLKGLLQTVTDGVGTLVAGFDRWVAYMRTGGDFSVFRES
ncbi:hypothetical protein Val02_07410 [Virgisporangium aliadipatigenens]|uniref:Uncharacterized protein n=1 Tax=Virgisporangium aliadipatigenens TaxID=741659 RepID=A0A8J4DMJ2_9ACTN|nr:hypothetical protein [Virgisporangium aliadipatigenens]GIJ43855.1 hypothetical protein Val02_07410 [Virgisporangium aliadipatigenens]